MRDWQTYWDTAPDAIEETDYLRQVGKTVQGQTISEEQFMQIINDVRKNLDLKPDDIVLDLCCGNGLITGRIADHCISITGIDYSAPLIRIAKKYQQPENARYYRGDVRELQNILGDIAQPFTKIMMYEALQHFPPDDLTPMLHSILNIAADDAVILLASVPDRARLWTFYNTPKRRLDFFMRSLRRQEALGTWWKQSYISRICESMNLQCEFIKQSEILHTAHYRIDVRITRRKSTNFNG